MRIRLYPLEALKANLTAITNKVSKQKVLPLVDVVFGEIEDAEGIDAARSFLSNCNQAVCGEYLLQRQRAEEQLLVEMKNHIKNLAVKLNSDGEPCYKSVDKSSFGMYLMLLEIEPFIVNKKKSS